MTRSIAIEVQLEEEVHRAVRLRAAKDQASVAEVINNALRKTLTAELEEASGLPPLADMIQNHHDLQQGVLRFPLPLPGDAQRAPPA